MEEKQLLREPSVEPTSKVIASGLGKTNTTYIKFIEELKSKDITLMDWRYYNDGKAWLSKGEFKWTTPRGTHKVKPLFWLSIWEGFFKVSFFFAESLRVELLDLEVSQNAKTAINSAKSMGKSQKFFPVVLDIRAAEQLADIYTLAKFRKERM